MQAEIPVIVKFPFSLLNSVMLYIRRGGECRVNDGYMNAKQIEKYIGICYAKALDFIKYSGIKYVKIGRTYFVSKETLDDFLSKNTYVNTKELIDSKYLI